MKDGKCRTGVKGQIMFTDARWKSKRSSTGVKGQIMFTDAHWKSKRLRSPVGSMVHAGKSKKILPNIQNPKLQIFLAFHHCHNFCSDKFITKPTHRSIIIMKVSFLAPLVLGTSTMLLSGAVAEVSLSRQFFPSIQYIVSFHLLILLLSPSAICGH